MLTRPAKVRGLRSDSVVVDNPPRSIRTWQERVRDPALTVLLILELCTIFLAVPLAAKGLSVAQAVADTLVLAVISIVVMLSLRWNAIILILLGLSATVASVVISTEASPISVIMLRLGGDILTFSALTWVVAHAVYAPGRITIRRLQGAIVMYLNFATIFAAAYGLIWDLSPMPSPISSCEKVARRKSGACCISASPR